MLVRIPSADILVCDICGYNVDDPGTSDAGLYRYVIAADPTDPSTITGVGYALPNYCPRCGAPTELLQHYPEYKQHITAYRYKE